MALPQAKHDATEARVAGVTLPEGAAWAKAAREAALARVRAMGLPSGRDEYWKFTKLDAFLAPTAPEAGMFTGHNPGIFDSVDRVKLVFRDGVFDANASDNLAEEGLEIARLAEVTALDVHWAKDLYGVLETAGHDPVPRPFAALNTATATDGVVIRATAKAKRPVALVYLHENTTSDVALHFLVRVEEGAEVTVLESGPAAARFNKVMEVDVADGAAFHHVRAQGRDHERHAVTHLNGRLTRNEAVIWMNGDNASAHVGGAAVGDGDFHHDDTVFVTHDAVAGESRQVFKKVLRNGAVGTFQGKILVKPDAQKTDGYQISQSLLLDDDAQFLAKPELEIYADDVACSHGSTTGAIDETALFYLRSRGVPLTEAQDLLVLAFLAEAIDEIADEELQGAILGWLEGWLLRHRAD